MPRKRIIEDSYVIPIKSYTHIRVKDDIKHRLVCYRNSIKSDYSGYVSLSNAIEKLLDFYHDNLS